MKLKVYKTSVKTSSKSASSSKTMLFFPSLKILVKEGFIINPILQLNFEENTLCCRIHRQSYSNNKI